MPDLLAARSQMAMSLGFHILFAMVGVAMPVLMVVAERRWQRTGDHIYLDLAHRWAKDTRLTMTWKATWTMATGGQLWRRRYRLARVATAGQVALILWGWALAQYPYLIPPDLTIRAAAAPRITLVLVLWVLVAGGLVLFPSLIYLLQVFKREPTRS
jgi:cytochrome d ubiquinol oxidase subunit II